MLAHYQYLRGPGKYPQARKAFGMAPATLSYLCLAGIRYNDKPCGCSWGKSHRRGLGHDGVTRMTMGSTGNGMAAALDWEQVTTIDSRSVITNWLSDPGQVTVF